MKYFSGAYTALITPFTEDDQLDEEGLRVLIRRQLQANIDGIVVLGTTGEAPTLQEWEKKRVMAIAKEECSSTPLIVGTGSYSTKQTIENTKEAENAGADAALIVIPYYNKPTQEGLYHHFKAIAQATSLPIILYNAPGRCSQNLHLDTLKRLLDIPTIVGIKETSGDMDQIIDVIGLVKNTRPDFTVVSGDDPLTLPLMALGGDGVISVISNILPREVKNLVTAMATGNFELAREIHHELMPITKIAFIETNPIPIKAMHQIYNLPGGKCRLPLCGPSTENYNKIKSQLKMVDLITNIC
jgi:4-hydroxy-tetrahydrodipicolinate synthase